MKSPKFASVALFCEDIRTEEQGINTVIGVMPDNVNYETEGDPEGAPQMPRLAIYARTMISVDESPSSGLHLKFHSPSGQLVAENLVEAEFLQHQLNIAREQNAPHATIISQFKMSPFPILEHGKFIMTAAFRDEEYITGFINIHGNGDVKNFD